MGYLPANWQKRTLAETCRIIAGFGFPERMQGRSEGPIPFFKVGDISEAWKRGQVHLTEANHYLTQEEALEIRAKPLPANTTVFAKIGAAIALNRRAMLSEPALVDNNVMGVIPSTEALHPKFLFHFICTVKLDELSRATTVPSVRKSDIEQIEVPVPPLQEQQRIVDEIEKQFTRLDAAVGALRRVKANLKRHRLAVLQSHLGDDRHLAAAVRPLAELIEGLQQGWSPKCDLTRSPLVDEWAIIATTAVQPMKYDDSQAKPLPMTLEPRPHIEIKVGDFLMTRKGPRRRAGVSCLVRSTRARLMICDTVYRFRCDSIKVFPPFLEIALNSPQVTAMIDSTKSGISESGVSLTHAKLGAVPITLPGLAEQKRVVAEVERHFSVVNDLERVVEANLRRAKRLRQSILQRAFSGKL